MGALCFAGLVPAAAGTPPNIFPNDALQALHSPGRTILYSLEPEDQPQAGDKVLYHVKILGQTGLDPARALRASRAFEKAVIDWSGYTADCFNPRHALTISSQGHAYDFLLCYSCRALNIYRDGILIASLGASGSPREMNQMLTDARLPLAKAGTIYK